MDRTVPLSKADAVFTDLQRAILSGELEPGARLRQDEVALQWGVSSTPVREAFRRLEADGLVDLLPHRGVVVRGPRSSLVAASDLPPGSDFP